MENNVLVFPDLFDRQRDILFTGSLLFYVSSFIFFFFLHARFYWFSRFETSHGYTCFICKYLKNSVFGAIYELNIWGYNSLRVSTLLSVMKIKINGVITFRPARSKVGIHITYMTRLTPRAQSQRKLLTVDLYSVEIKKWENKTHFSMNSDFLVLTQKKKKERTFLK